MPSLACQFFNGGLVGYFGYDCVWACGKQPVGMPEPDPFHALHSGLMVSDAVVRSDTQARDACDRRLPTYPEQLLQEQGPASLEALLEKLRQPITASYLDSAVHLLRPGAFRSSLPRMITNAPSIPSWGIHPRLRDCTAGGAAAAYHR